jgi:Aldehyde dehydrogenase family
LVNPRPKPERIAFVQVTVHVVLVRKPRILQTMASVVDTGTAPTDTTTCWNEPTVESNQQLLNHIVAIVRILTVGKQQHSNHNNMISMIIVMIIGTLTCLWLLVTLWNTYHVSYYLLIWYEYCFTSIPTMTIPDLPKSITEDADCYDDKDDASIASNSSSITSHTNRLIPPTIIQGQRPSILNPSRPNKIQCYDPSTDQYLGEVDVMTPQQIHDCCTKAKLAQQEWTRTTFAQRRIVLRTIQKYIVHNATMICRVSTKDSGKPILDGYLGEILTTTEKIRTLYDVGELWLRPSYRTTGIMFIYKIPRVEYVPYGIIAPIAPWNYPYVNS